MKLPAWNRDLQSWDRFKAFYLGVSQHDVVLGRGGGWGTPAMVLFDTGEVIFTDRNPRPDVRGSYRPLGVDIVTTKDYRGQLFTPNGDKIATAWLYDSGQQTLLVDYDTSRAVRVCRGYDPTRKNDDLIPGIPLRFQKEAAAYIPGAGLPPVGSASIVAWLPFNKANLAPNEKAHVQEMIDTARAALKLMDHAIVRTHYGSESISSGCPLDKLLAVTTWQDLAEANLGALYHHGAQRKRMMFNYLLTEKPE